MKNHSLTSLILAAMLLPGTLSAQSAIPSRISYQGTVTDITGALVAPAGAENHEVIFRLYDAATGGNLIYSEKQTVTISNGLFSALIGAGVEVTGEEAQGPGNIDISEAFGASARFLELTVATGEVITPSDQPVSPRQQMVSTSFAFRAKEAETVINGAINSDSITDGSINNIDLSGGIEASKLGGGAVNDTELAALDGVTSSVQGQLNDLQGQLNTKAPLGGNKHFTSLTRIDRLGLNRDATFSFPLYTMAVGPGGTTNTAEFQFPGGNTSHIHWGTTGDWYIRSGRNNGSVILQDSGGNVGIGAVPGNTARLVVSGFAANSFFPSWRRMRNTGIDAGANGTFNSSIHATGGINAFAFVAFSDERIKDVIGRSDSASDLTRLAKLEVTDYTYINKVEHGTQPQKKLIAQQVEKVFPEAVSLSKGFVPDIYQMTSHDQGWIQLESDLKVDATVKLYLSDKEIDATVTAVENGRFRVDQELKGKQVFVFGREVDDFRKVDYEAISMLNVSATQEIYRRLQTKEQEVESLKARLAELEKKDKARDAQLASIEKLLKQGTHTASFTQQATASK